LCGVCGWVDFGCDLTSKRGVLQAMTESLAARGPDGAGLWVSREAALGHRRLAVIDLPGGAQPMVHRDARGAVVLSFSGEVYNFRELRARLRARGHRFATAGDTEVVLRAYLEWSEAFAERLDGMLAAAVWDARRRELLLVRDRLGIKPLYYHRLPQGAVFASEPKAIFASRLLEPAIDERGACELVALVRTPGEAVFRGLREVRPGHTLRIGRAGVTERRYWALRARAHTDRPRETVAAVRRLLAAAVERQLVADVPLCTLLSGGLDSGALTALAARAHAGPAPLRSCCVTFAGERFRPDAMRGSPDGRYARLLAACAGTDHADISLDARELLSPDVWAAVLRAWDLPPRGDMDTSLYLLFKAIRPRATVALSGEGADELFGGYRWFDDHAAVSAATFPWLAMAGRLGRGDAFEPRLARGLDVGAHRRERYADALAEVPRLPGEDRLERRMREVSFLHLTRFLPMPLDRKDRMSMAAGMEVRVPFLDCGLVEYVFNVPWRVKRLAGADKGLLRVAVRDLLPPAVAARAKTPFPTTNDPAYHAALRDAVAELLADRDAPVMRLLHRPSVRALTVMPATGAQVVRMALERVLHLHAWIVRYGVRVEIDASRKAIRAS
jgi:asparagine synthase (glutamine-hydrolysing)